MKNMRLKVIPRYTKRIVPIFTLCGQCKKNKVVNHHFLCDKCYKLKVYKQKYKDKEVKQ